LVETREETGETVRAIKTVSARNSAIDAGAVFACKTSNAIIGVVAARFDAKASANGLVALVSRIPAVVVVLAPSTARHEAAREIFAAGGQTNLTDRARVWDPRIT
jgi:hypothetical protein